MRCIVAFDLDGTLVDSVGDIARALNGALAELDLAPVDVDVVRGFVGNGSRMLMQRALHSRTGRAPAPAAVDDALARFRAHYERALVGETRPFEGIPAALAALKDRALLAVATNKPAAFARPIVEALMPGVFSLVVGPEDAGGALKPDPAMLRHIERTLEGELAAFVGDSGVDVATAKNAGVPVIGVAWGLRPDELAGADAVAPEPAALPSVLARVLAG